MGVFRRIWWQYYERQKKFVIGVSAAITTLPSKVHPSRNMRLRDDTFRQLSYRPIRRKFPTTTPAPPTVAVVLPSKVHPSRNMRLRDRTFRPPWLMIFQPQHVVPPTTLEVGIAEILFKGMWRGSQKKMR